MAAAGRFEVVAALAVDVEWDDQDSGVSQLAALLDAHGVGYPERCDIEPAYVRRWTLLSDASALARTVGAVVRPGG